MQILQVIFGQELPDTATSFAQQAFAVGVAAIGLAAFALVLALVEQVRRSPSLKSHNVRALIYMAQTTLQNVIRVDRFASHCNCCDSGFPMQVVLQVVDENVARGSKVFETGHVRTLSSSCHFSSALVSGMG